MGRDRSDSPQRDRGHRGDNRDRRDDRRRDDRRDDRRRDDRRRDDRRDDRRGDRRDYDRRDRRQMEDERGRDRERQRDRRGRYDDDDEEKPVLEDRLCVRFGVENPRKPLTREQLIDELDGVRLAHRVVHVQVEGRSGRHEWGRMYFKTPEDADEAATELNIPLRQSKWRNFVTQRLPLPGPNSGEIGTIPAFEAHVEEPADTISVDTQEGFVHFSTDELYRSKGSEDYMQAKHQGKLIRRLICKHFDPERHISCRFGAGCGFIHVKAEAMNRMLSTCDHRAGLRASRNDEDIQVSLWEHERRTDTLIIRNLERNLDDAGLRYMFEACPGFMNSFLRKKDSKAYGVIRFHTQAHAMGALVQTYGCDLNIGFYGPMEDIRNMQLHIAKVEGKLTNYNRSFYKPGGAGGNLPPRQDRQQQQSQQQGSASGATPAPASKDAAGGSPVMGSSNAKPEFPELPEGWGHNLSRRTGQYYFYRLDEKSNTTWKHPTTNLTYKI